MSILRTLKDFLREHGPIVVVSTPDKALELMRGIKRFNLPVLVAYSEHEAPPHFPRVRAQGVREVFIVTMCATVASLTNGPHEAVVAIDPGETSSGIAVLVNDVLVSTSTRRGLKAVTRVVRELASLPSLSRLTIKLGITPTNPRLALAILKALERVAPEAEVLLIREDRAREVTTGDLMSRVDVGGKHEESALKILLTPARHCIRARGDSLGAFPAP